MKYQFIAGKPVTTTNFKSVQPLGVGGQLVLEQWEALYQILKHEVSPECAGLLLEPVIDRQRGEVDWYIPADLQSLKSSPVSEQMLREKAQHLIAQGKQLAQRMMQSSDVAQGQKGALLEQALSYPSEEYVIETPYGPALIAWGHQSSEKDQQAAVVSAKGGQQGIKSMSILPPPNLPLKDQGLMSYWPWLLGILFLILMIALPWWEGIIPIQYCQYYWLAPLILLLILLPIIGFFVRNYFVSAKRK